MCDLEHANIVFAVCAFGILSKSQSSVLCVRLRQSLSQKTSLWKIYYSEYEIIFHICKSLKIIAYTKIQVWVDGLWKIEKESMWAPTWEAKKKDNWIWGSWKDEGKGVLLARNGNKYKADWKEDDFHGTGKHVFENRAEHEGNRDGICGWAYLQWWMEKW